MSGQGTALSIIQTEAVHWRLFQTNVLSEQGYTLLSCSHYFYDRLIELHHALPDVM